MEDEESPDTGSPATPHRNGRITVTIAAAPPPPRKALTLALPIHQPPRTTAGNGGGREDCWCEAATSVLIDAWGERYLELKRGNLRQNHWKEVADIVNSREDYTKIPKTDIQCKNRIDTVKKKYKQEISKISCGGGPSKWPFFQRLDHLIGPVRSINQFQRQQNKKQSQQNQNQKQQQNQKQIPLIFGGRGPIDSDSSRSEPQPPSQDSADSLPPRKRSKTEKERNSKAVDGVRELSRAIMKFGEAYEHAESAKLQQLVEMEKQRMKFTKEIELQRMQFFMKTQLELSQLKKNRNSNHHTNNDNNNSDSSSQ